MAASRLTCAPTHAFSTASVAIGVRHKGVVYIKRIQCRNPCAPSQESAKRKAAVIDLTSDQQNVLLLTTPAKKTRVIGMAFEDDEVDAEVGA